MVPLRRDGEAHAGHRRDVARRAARREVRRHAAELRLRRGQPHDPADLGLRLEREEPVLLDHAHASDLLPLSAPRRGRGEGDAAGVAVARGSAAAGEAQRGRAAVHERDQAGRQRAHVHAQHDRRHDARRAARTTAPCGTSSARWWPRTRSRWCWSRNDRRTTARPERRAQSAEGRSRRRALSALRPLPSALCALLLAGAAHAASAPDWVQRAAAEPVPAQPARTAAVVLLRHDDAFVRAVGRGDDAAPARGEDPHVVGTRLRVRRRGVRQQHEAPHAARLEHRAVGRGDEAARARRHRDHGGELRGLHRHAHEVPRPPLGSRERHRLRVRDAREAVRAGVGVAVPGTDPGAARALRGARAGGLAARP